MPIPRRGEVWRVDLGMIGKVRPALVISVPLPDHEQALFGIVPYTSSARGTRFEAEVAVRGLDPGAFDAQGIRPVTAAAFIAKLAILTPQQMEEVEHVVRSWFDLA